ncbi:macrophage metalloelastase-like [Crassostrea virginica]
MESQFSHIFIIFVGVCFLSGKLICSAEQNYSGSSISKEETYEKSNSGNLASSSGRPMSVRRCGNEKIYRADRRSRRNVNVWEKNKLTWGFEKFSRKFKRIIQWRIFQKVLRIWSRHSKLRFKYSRKNPDIRILFARYDHGDGYYNAFDGQGKVIGHAFRPSDGGTHFDDDELWSLSSNLTNGQIHLPSVALHETGHALGLDHVNDFLSVMSAYYSKVKMTPSPVDIGQLNDLYGKRRSKKVEVSTVNSKSGLPGFIPPTKEGLGQALDGCRGIRDLITLQNRQCISIVPSSHAILDSWL